MRKIRALLVYPKFPLSFWGGNYALSFIGKRSTHPPLGLLTVAALFPQGKYELKLVDMNVEELTDEHLAWADSVWTSTMRVQRRSHEEVIRRCQATKIPVVAGGPDPTTHHDEISGVTHFVLGEVEDYFADFLHDFEAGTAKHIYQPKIDSNEVVFRPDLKNVPLPRFDLIQYTMHLYGSMCLQYSRGCPWDCDFCNETVLYGRVPRVKSPEQIITELELLYTHGWRGHVFFVDDNFIGNKNHVQRLLPVLTKWQQDHSYPFDFSTESSINLVDITGLPEDMVLAGFTMVFIGFETPNKEALEKTNKGQNIKADDPDYLLNAVHFLQRKGLEASGGFIIGLDGDNHPSLFDQIIDFIKRSGIATAMVGLLNIPKDTKLYFRYIEEGRLLQTSDGNNVSTTLNYVPEMDPDVLIAGYKRVLSTLYEPNLKNYYKHSCWTLIKNFNPGSKHRQKIEWQQILALFKIFGKIVLSKQGLNFLLFILKTALHDFRKIPMGLTLGVKGYHYQKITTQIVQVDEFNNYVKDQLEWLKKLMVSFSEYKIDEIRVEMKEIFNRILAMKSKIHLDYHLDIKEDLITFQRFLETEFANIVAQVSMKVPTFMKLN